MDTPANTMPPSLTLDDQEARVIDALWDENHGTQAQRFDVIAGRFDEADHARELPRAS